MSHLPISCFQLVMALSVFALLLVQLLHLRYINLNLFPPPTLVPVPVGNRMHDNGPVSTSRTSNSKSSAPLVPQVDAGLLNSKEWHPILSFSSDAPYNEMAPHLDVIWSRGWYNVGLPHKERPITYYCAKGQGSEALPMHTFQQYFRPEQCGIIWLRLGRDLSHWVDTVLPKSLCNISQIILVTSDNDDDVPNNLPSRVVDSIFNSSKIEAWYSTNVVVQNQPKLFPVPHGLAIHNGFDGSPHSAHTVQQMDKLRHAALPFQDRNRTVLFDVGTMGASARRDTGRKMAKEKLSQCLPGRVETMPRGNQLESWPRYASHQFAIAPVGVGYDTMRFWEYLFFGTVPIVLSSPLDSMYLDAHVPCVIVNDWNEVCNWTREDYDRMADKYEKWISNSHLWLRPSLWVPRDQDQMERICDASPGCRAGQ